MSNFSQQQYSKWSSSNFYTPGRGDSGKTNTSVLRKPDALPPLSTYSLDSLVSSLKRNQQIANDKDLVERLPDKGKKLFVSIEMIKEAIQQKLDVEGSEKSNGASPNQDALRLSEQLRSLTLSESSLVSSNSSSSSLSTVSRRSLSSVDSDKSRSNVAPAVPPIVIDRLRDKFNRPNNMKVMPTKEAQRLMRIEHSRQKSYASEASQRITANHTRSNSSATSHDSMYPNRVPPTNSFYYDDDDSDDFDGFSEDEYL